MNDDLLFSLEAQRTSIPIFSESNTVNIFVEDSGKEYIYEYIFCKMFGDDFHKNKIFSTNGKKGMEKYFRELGVYDSEDPNKKNIYLVDGDFDRYIYPENIINSRNYIYLKTYNIESYYIDKIAFETYAKGYIRCRHEELEQKVKFDLWLDTITKEASKLFFCYAYIKKNNPEDQSVSQSPYLFLDDKTGFEKDNKINLYISKVISEHEDAAEEIDKIKQIYFSQNDDEFNIICGKFLMDSLFMHLRNICLPYNRRTYRKDDLEWALITNMNVSKLDYVKERIIEIMRN